MLFVRAGPRPRIKAIVGGVLILACASALLYLLSQWPSIRGMPPDPLVKAFNADGVTPNTRGMPPVNRIVPAARPAAAG